MAGFAYRSRLVGLGILAAGVLAAVSASGAQAATQCSGEPEIGGQGAAVEKVAMAAWSNGFNTSTAKTACSGKQGSGGKPKVNYNATSSGAGLRSWGAEFKKVEEIKFGPSNAFVGTAEAPNETQQNDIIGQESTPTTGTLETLPVAQFALVVYANLPTGCTASSTAVSGRLVLNNSTLQEIFDGTITTWGGLKDGGDAITGPGSPSTAECQVDPITVVVRGEKAGTTNVLKKYLGLINTAPLTTASGEKTWQQLSEGSLNTVWPTALNPAKTTVEGDEAEADKVAAHAGQHRLLEPRGTP